MVRCLTLLTLICLSQPLSAGDVKMSPPVVEGITSPSLFVTENPVPSGSYAEVKYGLEKGDTVQWEVVPDPVKQSSYIDGQTGILYFNGKPGSYVVTAFVVNFDNKKFERKKAQVTIGKVDPIVPPKPVEPDVPTPSNELQQKINKAFEADKGTKADAVQLSALYKQAAKLAKDKKKAPSSNEFLRQVREASNGLIGDTTLLNVRTVVAEELSTIFGKPNDTDLTDQQRSATEEVMLKLSATLDAQLN